ncbi:hypothetical protein QCA50_016539 [Cerrena zonata]|uniref:Uncharacterized protein n=1 Tax=Cerrena zonata TaxID=2478898 RepID=A0AAW0FMR5_9APHY
MSAEEDVEAPRIDKGKGRAAPLHPTESTPLLASHSNSHQELEDYSTPRRHLCTRLFTVFTVTLLTCVLLLLVIVLIAYSYGSRASDISSDILIRRALVLRGPDRIDVLNFTQEEGLWVQVDGRIGVNAGAALEINSEEDDGLLAGMWKSLGQWGVRTLDSVTVNLSTIHVTSKHDLLANISFPPLDLPLTTNPPDNLSWLQKFSLPIHIKPTNDSSVLLRFAKESWKDGMINVKAAVDEATVSGGHLNENSWRKRLHLDRTDVTSNVRLRIPHLPGLPPPGHDIPFSELVSLRWFLIRSTPDKLVINATASVFNPLPENIAAAIPTLPFTILLPANDSSPIPIANVSTSPFSLSHPNVTLSIAGHVLPLDKSSSPYLSSFLSSYLSAEDAPILISSPLIHGIVVPSLFPAPRPPPQVLRNVTIKDMKIKPTNGGNMAASGTVFARVVLPRGINVGLDVNKVFPDVLIFDGPVSGEDDDPEDKALRRKVNVLGAPPERPLPDPLPERAFAHIRPDDWLPSISTPVETEGDEGSTVEVTAKIVDVPLQVLPGRDKEFRNFVGKVIFGSNGALAGVQGVAAVAVHVRGLPIKNGSGGEMELEGLPFQGSVRIGKKFM